MLLSLPLWVAQLVWGRDGVCDFRRHVLLDLSANTRFQLGVALSAAAVLTAVRAGFARSMNR